MNNEGPRCETLGGHLVNMFKVTDLTLSDNAQPFLKLEEKH